MDDQTLLKTLKNGIMIAGHEMGPVGDHWPAIHAISKGLDREFEEMARDEAVVGELEFHYADILNGIEETLNDAPADERKEFMKLVKDAWDQYYAVLEPFAPSCKPKLENLIEDNQHLVVNMLAAKEIIRSLGGKL